MMAGMPEEITEKVVLAALVIVLAIVLRAILRTAIKRVTGTLLARGPAPTEDSLGATARRMLARASGVQEERHRQRVLTLSSLLKNVVDVVVVAVALLTVLAIAGVPMTPLLASAGVGGVAIGFGAQSLVKDYLSGIFMLAEDQFGVGDLIMVGDLKGTVQEVTLRVTKIREPLGTVWYIRNGEILTLGNVSQGHSVAFVDIPVAIDEDPVRVTEVLRGAVAGMSEDPDWSVLMENPTVLGVDSMAGGTMVMRVMVRTGPDQHWGVMREVRRRAQVSLAAAGVRGPILPIPATGQPNA